MLFSKKKVLIKKSELWSILKIHFSYGCSVKFYDNVYDDNDKDVENVDTTWMSIAFFLLLLSLALVKNFS